MTAVPTPDSVLTLVRLDETSIQSMMVSFPLNNTLIHKERQRNIEVYDAELNVIGGAYQHGTMTNSDFHRYMEMVLTPATPQPLTFHVTDSTMMNLGPELPRNDDPIASPLFLRLGCNGEHIRRVLLNAL